MASKVYFHELQVVVLLIVIGVSRGLRLCFRSGKSLMLCSHYKQKHNRQSSYKLTPDTCHYGLRDKLQIKVELATTFFQHSNDVLKRQPIICVCF